MRTYGEFCPVSKAAELFGERWTPLVLRELVCGSTRFSDLQSGIPGIPRSMLSKRLKTLEHADVVERKATNSPRKVVYELTPRGRELCDVVVALGTWGQKWFNREITEQQVEPQLLVWDMHRRVHLDRLPDRRVVTQIDFSGAANETIWLVLEKPEPSVCDYDPGFDIDLFVKADALELTRIWMGTRSWKAALSQGTVRLRGPAEYTRDFPDWFKLNTFAGVGPG